MAVVIHEDIQTNQDAVRTVDEMTAQEAKVSAQAQGERIAKLEGRFEESDKHLATKADVKDVRVEVEKVRTEVETVRTEVETVRTEVEQVRTEVEQVRTEVAGLAGRVDSIDKKVGLLMWFIGIGVVVGLGFGGWIVMLLNSLLPRGVP